MPTAVLQESERRFHNLVDRSGDALFVVELDGRFAAANHRALELLGYAREELLRLRVQDVVPARSLDRFAAWWRRAVSGGNERTEGRLQRKDGTWFPVEVWSSVFEGTGTRVVQVLVRDVSERKRLERKLAAARVRRRKEREEELRVVQAARVNSLGEMATGVAHELNQPLSGIRTFAEGLLFGLEKRWEISPEEVVDTLRDIVEQVDRMTEIIDHMRALARESISKHAVFFQASTVVRNAFGLVGAQLRKQGVTVRLEVPEALPLCKGWPRQIEQALLNLIANAQQAMAGPAGRSGAGQDPTWRPVLDVSACAEEGGRTVRISVADTGGGVPEALLDRIFEPFFTTKSVGQGTGLGLSVARNIVENHGGRLEVVNRPGQGAIFSVVLPCAAQP